MASNQQAFNGLETFYFAYRDQIKSDSDAILLFVHWYLTRKGLLCVNDGSVCIFLQFKNVILFEFLSCKPDRKRKFCQKIGTMTKKFICSITHSTRKATN